MSPAKRSAKRAEVPLAAYNAKRDFTLTQEPPGKTAARSGKQLAFVIQKHAASHLHFDLRLECDGVMKSWAVPKGPSIDIAIKRLAMEVEDHPIAYNAFEGTIPAGEYGGGTVMLWDRGTYEPDEVNAGESGEDAVRRSLAAGKLAFTFHGDRLHGSFALVRTRRGEERAQWLLLKHHDRYASASHDIVADVTTSVASGRTMPEIAAGDNEALGSLEDGGAIEPMLPTHARLPLPAGEYAIEAAWSGTRVMAFISNGTAQLIQPSARRAHTSKALELSDTPDVQAALLRLARRRDLALVLDGVLTEGGQALVLVDLLLEGETLLVDEPWIERRTRLEAALVNAASPGRSKLQALRIGAWRASDAADVQAAAHELGTHNVIAKRIDSPYESGVSKLWLEFRA
jgi:bifunctional non-homologous end joining protein LigD